MKTCGECGLFCSCGALWPSGLCLPRGDRLIEADAAACVCWEKDWRGVDQSDGVAAPPSQRDALATEGKEEDEHERAEGVHGEGALGAADQRRAHDVRKPELPRFAGVLSGSRVRQPELF